MSPPRTKLEPGRVRPSLPRLGPAHPDIDPQASAATWADRRKTSSPAVIGARAPRLGPVLEVARNAGTELCIIDTAPHASDSAHAAAQAADLTLIPCCASVADLAAISTSVELARIADTTALAAITQATVGSTLAAEARDATAGYDLACAPVVVHHRLDHVQSADITAS